MYKLLLLVANEDSSVTAQMLEFPTADEADSAAEAIERYDKRDTYFQADTIKLYNLPAPTPGSTVKAQRWSSRWWSFFAARRRPISAA